MMYQFSPVVQALINSGKYIPVMSASGMPISIARDAATGQFAAHAIGVAGSGVGMLNPLTAAPQVLMGAGQMYQNQVAIQGIKALSASVAALQATTAVIGVGVAATTVLSAVNLWQTMKLREDVKQMRVDIRDGFIDIKQVLSDQSTELTEHIQQVSEDVQFNAHRTILARAYGLFKQATDRLESGLLADSMNVRHDEITAARDMMFSALSDYKNKQLMESVCAIAFLRRRECVWAIEQAIAMTYQMQGEWKIVSDRLTALDITIRNDALDTLEQAEESETYEVLDLLFPELTRIYNHDLAAIELWKTHTDWYQTLSPEELRQLNDFRTEETQDALESYPADFNHAEDEPDEFRFYEESRQKFAPLALRNSLVYQFDTEARREAETYIGERAELENLAALNLQNLCSTSPLSVANLFLYFAMRDESLIEQEAETEKQLETAGT